MRRASLVLGGGRDKRDEGRDERKSEAVRRSGIKEEKCIKKTPPLLYSNFIDFN